MKGRIHFPVLGLFVAALVGCHSSSVAVDGAPVQEKAGPSAMGSDYDRPGYVTKVVDGRLWVFKAQSKELEAFTKHGELAKHVIRPKAGPNGMTVKAPDEETLLGYLTLRAGFFSKIVDGRLWVFKAGSKELEAFLKHGELAKHLVRPKAGPFGLTVKAPDEETLLAYLCSKDGFVTKLVEGRVWVFRPGSKELADFEKHGELAKHVIRPRAGPGGITVKAPDAATLDAYLVGFNGRQHED